MASGGINDLRTAAHGRNESPGSPAPSSRILVVDDEEVVLSALRETLRRQGYEVVATASPVVGLEALRGEPFAVVIADQRMPLISGLELLDQARQVQPTATRILIAAVVNLDTVIEAINKGEIYRFIVKPWLREELLVAVKNAVQRHELLKHNDRLQSDALAMNGRLRELHQTLEERAGMLGRQNQELAQVTRALDRNRQRAVELALRTAEAFLPPLGGQGRRAAQLSGAMAQLLNFSDAERRDLENAALLHDIGLIGAPRSLIRRWRENPAALDDNERALIERHPILGQELSAFDPGMGAAGALIRAHHERVDGKGYPDGLAGDKISWRGRLLAVAVAFASSELTGADAVEEIKLQADAAFDPDAVRVLLRVLPLAGLPARREKQIPISELRPGMILARSLYAPNGLLLAPEGRQLSQTYIEKLLNHNRIQPITQTLVVCC